MVFWINYSSKYGQDARLSLDARLKTFVKSNTHHYTYTIKPFHVFIAVFVTLPMRKACDKIFGTHHPSCLNIPFQGEAIWKFPTKAQFVTNIRQRWLFNVLRFISRKRFITFRVMNGQHLDTGQLKTNLYWGYKNRLWE